MIDWIENKFKRFDQAIKIAVQFQFFKMFHNVWLDIASFSSSGNDKSGPIYNLLHISCGHFGSTHLCCWYKYKYKYTLFEQTRENNKNAFNPRSADEIVGKWSVKTQKWTLTAISGVS